MADTEKVSNKTWGKNIKDWTEIQEAQGKTGYDFVLNLLPENSSLQLLDIGCGTGGFCEMALKKNITVTGIDISSQFIEEAKRRIPVGTFLTAKMEQLPFDDKSFDVVCGFNAFQYSTDLQIALQEAKRVLTPSGQLIILIWAEESTCEIASFLKTVKSRLQPAPSESRNPFALSKDDKLEQVLSDAGFFKIKSEIVALHWHYTNVQTALKGLLSLGALSHTIEYNGIDTVQEAILQSIGNYKQPNGEIIFKNHYKILTSINN